MSAASLVGCGALCGFSFIFSDSISCFCPAEYPTSVPAKKNIRTMLNIATIKSHAFNLLFQVFW